MAVTVPATDAANLALQTQITALAALVAANANPAVLPQLTSQLDLLRQQLVMSLMSNAFYRTPGGGMASNNTPSFLNAATVLSTLTINT